MKYPLILLMLFVCFCSINAQTNTQPGLRDYQVSGGTLPDSILYIMSTDTAGTKIGLGRWRRADSLINSLGDHDFYGLNTNRPPFIGEDSIETALDTMYVLFKGLDGGLATKIEMLKNGTLQIDTDNGAAGDGRVYMRMNPYTSANNNTSFNFSMTRQDNVGIDRDNDVFNMGFNLTGGGSLERDNIGESAIGLSFENLYRTSGSNYSEFHLFFIDTNNVQYRPITFFLNRYDPLLWSGSFHVPKIEFRPASDVDPYFQFTNPDGIRAAMKFSDPVSNTGVELSCNPAARTFQFAETMGAGSTFYADQFDYSEFSGIRRGVSVNTPTKLIGVDGSGWLGDITLGWGLDLTGGTLLVDSSQVATQYDLTTISGGATDLTIGGAGPSYTIESSTGTDVTVANLYGLTLSESPANTLNFQVDTSKVATQYDISGFGTMSNWLLAASGTGGTETITNGETVTVSETTGLDVTRSTNTVSVALSIDEFSTDAASEGDELMLMYDPSGTNHELIDINDLPYVATEVDGSTSNELNTIEENNVSVQTGNITMDFQDPFDVAADGGTEVNVSLDGSEFATVTTAESTDYLLIHDSNGAGADVLEKMLWSDFVIDIIGFEEDNVNEGSGNTIDLGTGLDGAFTTPEYDISLDFNEFSTDAAAEGDEYIILYDPSAGDEEKLLLTTVTADLNGMWSASNDNTNIANSTFEVGVPGYLDFRDGSEHDLYIDAANDRIGMGTNSPNYGLHVKNDAGAAIEANAAGVNEVLKIEGTADGGGVVNAESSLLFNYTDADYAAGAEQQGLDMTLYKEADATQWTTLKMTMKEATDADAIVLEKNADFTGNTTESHVAFNGGIAYTQNYDGSTAGADLNLDRSYYTINITGGNLTDTIKLPEVAYTTDNWNASLTSTQCQVGQEYVISNLRSGVNLVISAYNPAGTSDDLIGTRTAPGGSAGSAISIAPGKSVIIKCYQLASGIGYWNYWLSN